MVKRNFWLGFIGVCGRRFEKNMCSESKISTRIERLKNESESGMRTEI